jgi:hypothetical protein
MLREVSGHDVPRLGFGKNLSDSLKAAGHQRRTYLLAVDEVRPANLGVSSIFLACKALREYFYRIPEREGSTGRQTFYDVLQLPSTPSAAELRVPFKLPQLELGAKRSLRTENVLLERAFNILGNPGLRACYP